MIVFPNAKINIGLQVTGKRPDGYHNLETVFYPVKICDVLEVIDDNTTPAGVTATYSGLAVPGNTEDNLCLKACRLLQADFPRLPAVKMHLHKTIPMGAGLGGGSSDGAAMLQLLNQKFSLGIDDRQLSVYALQLGSDAPFFIFNKPAYATSRGELLEPLTLDLSGYAMLIINPGIHVSTAEAFRELKLRASVADLRAAVQKPVTAWKEVIVNDFETTVCQKHPSLLQLKQELYSRGALYASMTGSGSTFYAIFEKKTSTPFNFPPQSFYKWV